MFDMDIPKFFSFSRCCQCSGATKNKRRILRRKLLCHCLNVTTAVDTLNGTASKVLC